MAETKPTPEFVARHLIEDYFPGLSPKTLANKNSLGQGPTPHKRDRKVFYLFREVCNYVEGGTK